MTEDDDSRWMTKAELARARGISVTSADRLVRRHRWRREPGNDGRARVLVPPGWIRPRTLNRVDDQPDASNVPAASLVDIGRAIQLLENTVSVLRGQLDRAYGRAAVAEERERELRARLSDEIGRLMTTHHAEVARLREVHGEALDRQRQQHALETARHRDAAQRDSRLIEELRAGIDVLRARSTSQEEALSSLSSHLDAPRTMEPEPEPLGFPLDPRPPATTRDASGEPASRGRWWPRLRPGRPSR